MYYNDHDPPHFHARYAEQEAVFAMGDGAVVRGSLPNAQLVLVRAWAELYHGELLLNWERARRGVPLERIPGLDSRGRGEGGGDGA